MADRLLNEGIVSQVQEVFAQLNHPVEVLFFGRKSDCDYCQDTLQLVEELVEISGKLHLQTFDIDEDAAVAKQYNVDKVPGLVIAGRDGDKILDYGVRLAGIPSGHEFSSLIQDMILVSNRDSGLDSDTREFLGGLTQPVLLQVFVTPT
jgi:alkyl hydroperoxide reductase subunit AhpF